MTSLGREQAKELGALPYILRSGEVEHVDDFSELLQAVNAAGTKTA